MTNGIPHRRSIFGPILLIAIGVMFLLVQFHVVPVASAWRLFADYWPVLLIVWGVAKLIDYFAAQASGAPPPRTLSGGEVVLLIFLLMFGIAASTANWVGSQPGWNDDLGIFFGRRYNFSEDLPAKTIKPNVNISAQTDRGNISLVAGEGTELKVSVVKLAPGMDEKEAKDRASQASVAIHEVSGGYEIVPERHGDWGGRVQLDLEIHVPKQVSVTARTNRGNVTVTGVTGSVTVNSQRGDIEVRGVGGEVAVEVSRGDVRVVGAGGNVRLTGNGNELELSDIAGEAYVQGQYYGPIRFSKIAKQVHFLSQVTDLTIAQLPGRLDLGGGQLEVDDVPGTVSLTTRDKDIAFNNVNGRIKIESRRGNIELRLGQPPKDDIEVSNERGSVDLTLPGNSTFELSAASTRGEVECDFQGPELKVTQERNSGKAEGKIGARGPRIQLQTTYGTVSIRKGIETSPKK